MPYPFHVRGRKRPQKTEGAVHHAANVTLDPVILEFAQRFPDLRRKAADGSEVDEANLVVRHDDKICWVRIGVKKQLFLYFTLHDHNDLLCQRFWVDPDALHIG